MIRLLKLLGGTSIVRVDEFSMDSSGLPGEVGK